MEDCISAKIKKMKMSKVSLTKSKLPGEIILTDVSYIKRESLGKMNMWILIEDQVSKMKWRYFGRRKNELINIVYDFIIKLKKENKTLVDT
jgi:hypothetical protein